MFKEKLDNVRTAHPLVHNITNYVTVNDVANVLLACGGSPIMSDDINDVEDITSICGGLNINIGTLNGNTIPSMIAAGKKANKLGHPVLLDPVGAGASRLRTETSLALLKEVKFDVIRGNMSEIKCLALGSGNTHGVDAAEGDAVTDENMDDVIAFIREFSAATGAVIAMTGAIDIVSDDKKTYIIRNGNAMMSTITGTGCQLSGLTTAYIVANPDDKLTAAAAAVTSMGLCGEIAYGRLSEMDGNSSYRNYIIDAIFNLTGEALDAGAKVEIRE